MAHSIHDIWTIPPMIIQIILRKNGHDLTSNINYDRALVAQIYYNAGYIVSDEAEWVTHSQFLHVMSEMGTSDDPQIGMQRLREPFQRKLLHLYRSLYGAWSAADEADEINNDGLRAAVGNSIDVVASIISDAAGDSYWDAKHVVTEAFVAAEIAAANALRIATQLLGETPRTPQILIDLGRVTAEAAWRVVIEEDAVIGSKIDEIKLEKKDFQPSKIYERLLGADLSLMIPRARCFYLYSIWELLQLVPNEIFAGQLQILLTQTTNSIPLRDCSFRNSCLDLFQSEYPVDIADPHLAKALGPLLLESIGVPSRSVIMQRLLAM